MRKQSKDRGVVIFAFNNEGIDYLRLAHECAQRVISHWNLPVTVVTDTPFSSDTVDCLTLNSPELQSSRYYRDYGSAFKFINGNRHESFALSPYKESIVIDSDFLVSSSQVVDVWNGRGVKLSKTAYPIDGEPLPYDMMELGTDGLPMYLATIVCFDRSAESALFFRYWAKARKWYKAYSKIYNYSARMFRNDFCVTIALDLMAQKLGDTEPWTLHYDIPVAGFNMEVVDIEPLRFVTHGEVVAYSSTDVHVLNKKPLLDLLTRRT